MPPEARPNGEPQNRSANGNRRYRRQPTAAGGIVSGSGELVGDNPQTHGRPRLNRQIAALSHPAITACPTHRIDADSSLLPDRKQTPQPHISRSEDRRPRTPPANVSYDTEFSDDERLIRSSAVGRAEHPTDSRKSFGPPPNERPPTGLEKYLRKFRVIYLESRKIDLSLHSLRGISSAG